MTTSAPYISRLSGKCGRVDISQPYGPPGPVTGIALLLLGSLFDLEDGGNMFLRKVDLLAPESISLYPREQNSLQSPL
jgi:hypothetical protein